MSITSSDAEDAGAAAGWTIGNRIRGTGGASRSQSVFQMRIRGSEATSPAPGVTLSTTSATVVAGSTTTYTVVLDSAPTADVTVTPTSGTTAAATVSPSTLTFTSANWNAAQTVTVTGVMEGSSTITHAASSTDTNYGSSLSIGSVAVTVNAATSLVSNIGKAPFGVVPFGGTGLPGRTMAQAFTTGPSTYTLDSIEVRLNKQGGVTSSQVRAELWSSSSGAPNMKVYDLTPPSSFGTNGDNKIYAFTAPSNALLSPSTVYHFVIYTTVNERDLRASPTNDNDETAVAGWSIADGAHQLDSINPTSSTTWGSTVGQALRIRVKGAEVTPPSTLTLSVAQASVAENVGTVTVTATLDQPAVSDGVAVTLTATGTAADTADYTLPSQFTIAQGQTTGTATVAVVNDNLDESNETVVLDATTTPSLSVTGVTLTITDDDTHGVTVSKTSAATAVGSTTTYTVVLNSQPTAAVTITPTSGTTAVATVAPSTLTFTTTNWNVAQTVTVTGVAAGSSTITHAAASTDSQYNGESIGSVTANIAGIDADLSALAVNTSTDGSDFSDSLDLTPDFAADETSYTASVSNDVTHVKLTPTVNDSNATVEAGKGASLSTVTSGEAGDAIPLTVGANTLTVKVTAQDTTTTKTYTVTVTRRTPVPANMVRFVSVVPGDGQLVVTWEMAAGVNFKQLEWRVKDLYRDVAGDQPSPWLPYYSDPLPAGYAITTATIPRSYQTAMANGHVYELRIRGVYGAANTLTPWVTSEGTPAGDVDAAVELSALAVATSTDGSNFTGTLGLTPAFDADTTFYNARVAGNVTHLKLTPTAATGATVKVGVKGGTLATVTSGSATTALALGVGWATYAVEVTSADGNSTQTYEVEVLRLAAPTGVTAVASACDGTPAITINADPAGRTNYSVQFQVRLASETSWGPRTGGLDVSAASLTREAVCGNAVGGLHKNTAYHVRAHYFDAVRAHGARTAGTPVEISSQIVTVTTWDEPGKPTGVTVAPTTANDDELTASWTAPTNTGGPGTSITGYKVRWRVKDADATTPGDQAGAWNNNNGVDATGASHLLDNLMTETTYQVQVRASNGIPSGWTDIVEGTTAPLAPGNYQIGAGDGKLTITWDAIASPRSFTSGAVRWRVKDTDATTTGDQPGSWMPGDSGQALVSSEWNARSVVVPPARCTTCTALTNYTTEYEVAITFTVSGGSAGWQDAGSATPQGMPPTTVTLSLDSSTVAENAGSATVTITLDQPPGVDGTTVALSASGTATATADYSLPEAFTIPVNVSSVTRSVTIVDDDLDESNETIVLTASSPGLTVTGATLTIIDDDTHGVTLNQTSRTVPVGSNRAYGIKLDSQPTANVTVTPHSSNTGKAAVSGPLTFTPANWSQIQQVAITGVAEGSATVTHTTTSTDPQYNGEQVGSVSVTITIMRTPGVSVSRASRTVSVDYATHYSVRLDSDPDAPVTITATSSDTGKATVSKALTFTSDNWSRQQFFTVTGVAVGSATISHTAYSSDSQYNGMTVDSVILTVDAAPSAGVTISPTSRTVVEGSTMTYAITLNARPTASVTITPISADPSKAYVWPQSVTFSPEAWSITHLITITGGNNGSTTINHTATSDDANYAGITVGSVAVTVGLAAPARQDGDWWAARLAVRHDGNMQGCDASSGTAGDRCSSPTTLSEDSFILGGVEHTVDVITLDFSTDSDLVLSFAGNEIPASLRHGATLIFDGRSFPMADAETTSSDASFKWTATGIGSTDYADGQIVTVRLRTAEPDAANWHPTFDVRRLDGTGDTWGCRNGVTLGSVPGRVGGAECSDPAVLGGNTVSYTRIINDETWTETYVVHELYSNPRELVLTMGTYPTPPRSFVLTIGDRRFPLATAQREKNTDGSEGLTYRWPLGPRDTGLRYIPRGARIGFAYPRTSLDSIRVHYDGSYERTGEFWSATLTAADVSAGGIPNARGCDESIARCSSTSVLTDDDFTYNNVDYEVTNLYATGSSLILILNKTIPADLKSALTLNVGSSQFSLADATIISTSQTNDALSWTNTGLSWAVGDTVQLRLTGPVRVLGADGYRSWAKPGVSAVYHPALIAVVPGHFPSRDPAKGMVTTTHVKFRAWAATPGSTMEIGKGTHDTGPATYTALADGELSDAIELDTATSYTHVYIRVTNGDQIAVHHVIVDPPPRTYKLAPEVRVAEGEDAAITLTLGSAAQAAGVTFDVTVDYGDGGATPEDVGAVPTTVTVPGGQTSVQIVIPTVDDDEVEDLLEHEERFTVSVSHSGYPSWAEDPNATATAVVTIVDNDEPPEIVEIEPPAGPEPWDIRIVPGDGTLTVTWRVGTRDASVQDRIMHALRWSQRTGGPHSWANPRDPRAVGRNDGVAVQPGTTSYVITGLENDVITDVFVRSFLGHPRNPDAYNISERERTSSKWVKTAGEDTTPRAPERPQGPVPPTVSAPIADAAIVNESGTHTVPLSGVFDDANGDALTLTAASSDTATATASVSADQSTLTVTAKARGTATVTVTADDGNGGTVSDEFTVTVKAAPVVASALPDLTSTRVESLQVFLAGVFSDADNDALTITVSSSDTAVVYADVWQPDQSGLTLGARARGTATITVTARDADGNAVSDDFTVKLKAAPVVASAIEDVSGLDPGSTRDVSLSGVFTDADGDAMTITAESSDTARATVTVASDGSRLTLTGVAAGSSTITVTAEDADGNTVSDAFTVSVGNADPPEQNDYADLIARMYEWRNDPQRAHEKAHTDRWDRALLAFGETVADASLTAMPASEAQQYADRGWQRWVEVAEALKEIEQAQGQQQPPANNAPTVAAPIANATIVNASGTKQVSLSGVFSDADGDSLTITARSSDTAKATASVSADQSTLTVTAKARGTATITVTADDGNGGTVEDEFTVTVKAAPVVASALTDVTGLEAGSTRDVSLSSVFSDADGDSLTITARSSDTAKATVSVASDGSKLTLTGVAAGSATVTVTARDADGNTVSDSFDVAVAKKYASLIAQMYQWRNDPQWSSNKDHTDRWDRALLAFGETIADTSLTAMTATEAQGYADRGWERWVPVAKALKELEGG